MKAFLSIKKLLKQLAFCALLIGVAAVSLTVHANKPVSNDQQPLGTISITNPTNNAGVKDRIEPYNEAKGNIKSSTSGATTNEICLNCWWPD